MPRSVHSLQLGHWPPWWSQCWNRLASWLHYHFLHLVRFHAVRAGQQRAKARYQDWHGTGNHVLHWWDIIDLGHLCFHQGRLKVRPEHLAHSFSFSIQLRDFWNRHGSSTRLFLVVQHDLCHLNHLCAQWWQGAHQEERRDAIESERAHENHREHLLVSWG